MTGTAAVETRESEPDTAQLPPAPSSTSGFTHLPALDGLRGVAVIAVLLFHGGVSWMPGGFLGVDMFFVLSGFLITSLLLAEQHRSGTIGLGPFWARRARRLLPALLLLIGGVALYAWLVASPEARAGIRTDVFATLAYLANWHFIANQSSYFARTGDPSPLAHTWSLAIEEQFYLIWPILVLVLTRWWRRRLALAAVGLMAGLGAVASGAAMAAIYRPGSDPSRAYYGTDTRSQVIMIGALLAVLVTARRRSAAGSDADPEQTGDRAFPPWAQKLAGAAGVLAAAAVGVAVAKASGTDAWIYRGGLFGIALAVAVVIAAIAIAPGSPAPWLLRSSPLRWVGTISYGLYLYHWPIFLVVDHARTGLLGPALLGARLAATVVAASGSYYLLEMPIRRGALGRQWQRAGLSVGVLAVVGATVAATTLPAEASSTGIPRARPAVAPQPPGLSNRRPPLAPGAPLKVMVLGDSVAETLAVGLQVPARQDGLALDNEGTMGCGVVRGGPYRYFGSLDAELEQCKTWPQRWSRLIAEHQPDVVFMVVGRWEVMDRVHDGAWTHVGIPAFDQYLSSELDRAITILSSGGAVVSIATAPYYLRGERPDGGRWPEDDPARVDAFNALLRAEAARHPHSVALIDLGGHTSIGGTYTPYVDGIEMRYDGVHFTPRADRWLAPWLLPQLRAVGPPPAPVPVTSSSTTR